jgi:hypothetical protein
MWIGRFQGTNPRKRLKAMDNEAERKGSVLESKNSDVSC